MCGTQPLVPPSRLACANNVGVLHVTEQPASLHKAHLLGSLQYLSGSWLSALPIHVVEDEDSSHVSAISPNIKCFRGALHDLESPRLQFV